MVVIDHLCSIFPISSDSYWWFIVNWKVNEWGKSTSQLHFITKLKLQGNLTGTYCSKMTMDHVPKVRVCLDTAYYWKLKTYYWKYYSKIIFKLWIVHVGPNFKVINTFFRTSWSVNGARDKEENTNTWTKTLYKRTLSQYFAKT